MNLIDNLMRQVQAHNSANETPATQICLGEEAYRVLMRYNLGVQAPDEPKLCGCTITLDRNMPTCSIKIC